MNLSNVNLGTGPSSGDGDSLRDAFNIINNNFQIFYNNIQSLNQSVTTVAGRTGNVVLTVNDVIGAASTSYVVSAVTTAINGNLTFTNLLPQLTATYDLGSVTRSWHNLYVSNTGLHLGNSILSVDSHANLVLNGNVLPTVAYVNQAIVDIANLRTYAWTANLSAYAASANITAANVGMRGYVDAGDASLNNYINSQVTAANTKANTANTVMRGYVDVSNTSMRQYVAGQITAVNAAVVTANVGIQGFIALGNTNLRNYVDGQITAANAAQLLANTIQNNIINGVIANVTINSNAIAAVNANVVQANVGMRGYVDFANAVMSDLVYNGSNLLVAYINGQISAANTGSYSNAKVADYLPTYSGNLANVRMGVAGRITFADGTVQTTAAYGGGAAYGNSNVTAYLNTLGYSPYSNVNVAVYLRYGNVANISTAGNVTAQYFIGNGALLTGIAASSNYSNLQVATYLQSGNVANISAAGNITATYFVGNGALLTGITSNYSNVQTAAYAQTQGYTNYSNVNLQAYLGSDVVIGGNLTINGNLFLNGNTTLLNTNNLIINDNIIYLANANPSNVLDLGFVGHFTSSRYQHTGFVRQAASGQWKLFSNVTAEPGNTLDFTAAVYDDIQVGNITSPTIVSLLANAATQSDLIIATNSNITQANLGLKGYVDSQTFYSNARVATYLQSGNIANISAAGNITATYFVGNGALLTGITASSNYSNAQVATYMPTYSGNIANVRLGISGVLTFADGTTMTTAASGGGGNYGNANVTAYTVTMGFTNFSNVNVAALITTNGLTNYSNVNVKAYTESMGYQNFGNVNVAAYVTSANSAIIGYIDQANTIQSNQIGAANLAITAANLGMKGYVDSVATLSSYSNSNVTAYTVSMGFTNFSNVNVAALITTNGLTNYSNVNVKAYTESMGFSDFSNVNVAAYLGTGTITVANVKLAPSGNITFADGTAQTSAYSNVNLIANLRVTNVVVGNLTILGSLNTTLNIGNSFIGLATDNTSNSNDIGFYGQYSVGQGNVFTGLAYTATDGMYRLFSNLSTEPSTTINTASIRYSNIQVGNILAANVTVNTVIASNVYVNGGVSFSGIANVNMLNASGNLSVAGNTALYGNLTVGTVGAVAGVFHTVVGNITQVTSGGTVGFNTIGNISASVANFNAGNVGGFAIGYRDVPQITAANVTLIASDAGKHYYGSNTNPVTLTIPLNSSVAFGNGTAISLVNQGTGNITITPTTGVLLYLAGNTVTGSKTLTSYGMATLLKVQVNTWFINGSGVV